MSVLSLSNANRLAKTAKFLRPWKKGHSTFLLSQFSHSQKNAEAGYTDDEHLIAASDWLRTAQDATTDGGITGRYRFNSGWTSSYPETTGYIVPTFINLASYLNDPSFLIRSEQAINFLLALQLESGAFPGAEVKQNLSQPSPFNTAQIIHGLISWHKKTGCERTLESASRAGDWLLSVQDDDGAFRQHFYNDTPSTYSAHLTCWLAQLGVYLNEQKYLEAVNKHMDWVMIHQTADTGWVDLCGFDSIQHANRSAFTHTIAYTLWGMIYSGKILGRKDVTDSAEKAAWGIARRLELSKSLPGKLDWRWKSDSNFICLTGNAQMALTWMDLFQDSGDPRWLNAAFKAIDEIKMAQDMTNGNKAVKGGIPGSYPIWGDYIPSAIPNWAAKYFIDALIKKNEVLSKLGDREISPAEELHDLPRSLPEIKDINPNKPNLVVLTRSDSSRLDHFASLNASGFRPNVVVFETIPDNPVFERIREFIKRYGIVSLVWRVIAKRKYDAGIANSAGEKVLTAYEYCRLHNITTLRVGLLSTIESQSLIRGLKPDLLIQAGVGIIPLEVIEIPTLGTLNVHMSILPFYRGMNVAEWAAFNGHNNGCTVHLIDEGIDTGEILLVRGVTRKARQSVASLRAEIDKTQREILGEVVEYIVTTGTLPPTYDQSTSKGRQYYAMHGDIKNVLEDELASTTVLRNI